jgi:hypothetical protein
MTTAKTHNTKNPQVMEFHDGWIIYGAFTAMMRANIMGEVVYSNMAADSTEYKRMLKALRARTSNSNSPNGEG